MPLLGAIVLLIQFSFVYHVFKTGRPYWWMFIIMAFPVMGCLIYYFVEVYPGSRQERQAHKAARRLIKKLQPDADLKKRAEELEICGSVDNKVALAGECFNHQMYTEAASLYESCLQGAFAKDSAVLFGLARACVEGEDWEKAEAALARLQEDAPKHRPLDVRLLVARTLQGRGRNDEAQAAYQALLPEFVGLEARFRYGELLRQLGQQEAALQMFNEVIAHAKRFASSLEDERQWVVAARQAVTPGR
ncbi:MAG: hypothetical protein BWY57_02650 [Betaproteobacteria bacterium ADurb.Bin341]|nr:MAG: hypothetical protein BWY57_02650 [Betaproteobacteria bacterium ADurb.Bin341]